MHPSQIRRIDDNYERRAKLTKGEYSDRSDVPVRVQFFRFESSGRTVIKWIFSDQASCFSPSYSCSRVVGGAEENGRYICVCESELK